MNNQDLLTEVAYRASDEVLLSFSRIPSVWNLLKPILEKQDFWYRRTMESFNLPEEWQQKNNEDWHQIYNILTLTRDGNNPFSYSKKNRDILELNKYNLTTMKILLKWGYDPSIDHSHILNGAAMFGNPEVVQLLLNDERVDPTDYIEDSDGELIDDITGGAWALSFAVNKNRVDNVRILIADERIQDIMEDDYNQLGNSLEQSAKKNRVEMIEALLEYPKKMVGGLGWKLLHMAAEAAEYGSVDVLKLLFRRGLILDFSRDTSKIVLNRAIGIDNPEFFSVLLSSSRGVPSVAVLLHRVAKRGGPNILKMLLRDKNLNFNDIANAIADVIFASRSPKKEEMLAILLDDPRSAGTEDTLIGILNRGESLTETMENIIIRSRYINTERLVDNLVNIFRGSYPLIRNISNMIGVPIASIQSILKTRTGSDYNKYHFEMLFREIVVKRRDLEYYIDWIIARLARENTSQELRDLFSAAADSVLSSDKVIHTSDLFTAYSGFLLLANEKNVEAIMNTLREEHASEEGLKKAGLLLAAFSRRENK